MIVSAEMMRNQKSALGELRDIIKMRDETARLVAFGYWQARWVEEGFIDSQFDSMLARSMADGPARRRVEDEACVQALAAEMSHRHTVMIEDRGEQMVESAGEKFLAYVSRITMTALRAMPRR